MYVDLVVVVVAPWGPGEGGRSQHCKSRGPQSLPWKGSWCLAHLPPPGSILTSTLEPGQEFQDHLEEFPEIVKLAVDVSAHRHRRIYSLHVALLNCKIILLTKYQVFFYKSIPRISLALAHRILTSLSLITSHFLNCSICWSRSLVSPILARNTPYLK